MRFFRNRILGVILALALPGSSLGQTFNDVPDDYWAFSFIESFSGRGITSGCGGGNFCPEDAVTRAQMAVFLERGMRGGYYNPPAASGSIFLDVGSGDFAAAFIERLFLDGITAGCGNDNYCPNQEVTRAQMAVFLLRARYGAEYQPPAASGIFADAPPGSFAAGWIESLAAEGITSGCGNGNFCPDDAVTRAQMAVFFERTFGDLPAYRSPAPLSSIDSFGSIPDGRSIGPWLTESADLNGDDLEDFVMSKWVGPLNEAAPAFTPLLALNDGQGSFTDATTLIVADPLPEYFLVRGVLFADFNDDSQLDIFFSNHGLEYDIGNGEFPCEKNGLLLSGPDGLLHDVSDTNLPDLQDFSHGSSAADVDGDNDIDIWVNNLGCNNGPPSYLLENDGSGTFTIVANGPAFIQGPLPPELVGANGRLPDDYVNSSWATFLDADNDGDEDLYISTTDPETPQRVLLNDGSGAFEFAEPAFLPDPVLPFIQDSIAADINEDGRTDLILFQFNDSAPGGYALQLLISRSPGGFVDETNLRLPPQTHQQNGAGFPQFRVGDLNGDNHDDILIKMYSNDFSEEVSDFYLNDGTGTFRRLPDWTFAEVRPGFLPIDLTNDGYADFVMPGDPTADGSQILVIESQP